MRGSSIKTAFLVALSIAVGELGASAVCPTTPVSGKGWQPGAPVSVFIDKTAFSDAQMTQMAVAIQMAACAELQNQSDFWKVHDFLFDNQRTLNTENLAQSVDEFILNSTKLDRVQFGTCVDKELTLGIVTKDINIAQQLGVRATPTIFVNGIRFQGVGNIPQLIAIIESAASGKTALSPSETPGISECVRPDKLPLLGSPGINLPVIAGSLGDEFKQQMGNVGQTKMTVKRSDPLPR